MTEEPPIDWQVGVKQYGGDENMYKLMLERFEELTFNQTMRSLFNNIMKMEYDSIVSDASVLKASSKYLAAGRCEKFSSEIERGALKQNERGIVDNFLYLLTEAKALKVYIANMNKVTSDISEFERFENEITRKFPSIVENHQAKISLQHSTGCCTACNIFQKVF